MKKFPEFLIFDFDGVIYDDTVLRQSQINNVLMELGCLPLPNEFFRQNWGKRFEDLAVCIREYRNLDEECFAIFLKRDKELFGIKEKELVMGSNKGLLNALRSLNRFGFYSGIITSRSKQSLENAAKKIGLDLSIFNYVQTTDDWPVHKPEAGVFKPLIDFVEEIYYADMTDGFVGRRIAYFGDTINYDFCAVKNARPCFGPIKFIGVCSGANTFEEFQAVGLEETEIITSHESLEFFLKRLMQESAVPRTAAVL